MGSINSFTEDLEKYDDYSLNRFKIALGTLQEWDYFRQEYEGTNIFTLLNIINHILKERKQK